MRGKEREERRGEERRGEERDTVKKKRSNSRKGKKG